MSCSGGSFFFWVVTPFPCVRVVPFLFDVSSLMSIWVSRRGHTCVSVVLWVRLGALVLFVVPLVPIRVRSTVGYRGGLGWFEFHYFKSCLMWHFVQILGKVEWHLLRNRSSALKKGLFNFQNPLKRATLKM